MYKKISILLLFTCCLMQTFAQTKKNNKYIDSRSRKYTNEIVDFVSNVTIKQTDALFTINKQVTIDFDSVKSLNLESNEYRAAARNIFKKRDAAVKLILDVNQFDEFLMLQEEKKQESFKKRKEKEEKEEKEEKIKIELNNKINYSKPIIDSGKKN